MSEERVIEERPEFAKHIVAKYNPRTFDEDGLPEAQIINLLCEKCQKTHRVTCTSGAVRNHIHNFAVVHFHADPFEVKS